MSLTKWEMFEIKQRANELLNNACSLLSKNRNIEITVDTSQEHFLAELLLVNIIYPTGKNIWISFTKQSLYEPNAAVDKFAGYLAALMKIEEWKALSSQLPRDKFLVLVIAGCLLSAGRSWSTF